MQARRETAAVGALLHVYYLDLLPVLVERLAGFPPASTFLVSTPREYVDTVAGSLRESFPRALIDCRGVPNAGRDMGPMLVEFAGALRGLDVVCKLHTKKSPHHGSTHAWREFLLHNLAGSGAAVDETITLFEDDPALGAVFPSAGLALKAWMEWDDNALQAVGPVCASLDLDPMSVPDFPAGSMYWFRPRALGRLLDQSWSWRDFRQGEEAALSGTLAHGLERLILAVMNQHGYTWRKINRAGGRRRAADCFRGNGTPAIAVVLHVWSMNGIMSIVAGLKNLAFDFDLLVSVSSNVEPELRALLLQHFPTSRVRLFRVANAGHDIGPFLALGAHLERYRLACKLHIKSRSPEWFAYLLDNLVGGIAEVNTVMAMFARDPSLGVVYPETFPPARPYQGWGSNFENACALCRRLALPPPDGRRAKFASGSMFWFRPACLAGLLRPGLELPFSEQDNSRSDGALSHAVERLFLHAAQSAGYRTQAVLFHPYRGSADLDLYPPASAGD